MTAWTREFHRRATLSENIPFLYGEPDHCLCHRFVTYHVALHRNPGKTALIISHLDPLPLPALLRNCQPEGCAEVL